MGYVGNDDLKPDTDSEIEIVFSQRSNDDSNDDDKIFDASFDENLASTEMSNPPNLVTAIHNFDSDQGNEEAHPPNLLRSDSEECSAGSVEVDFYSEKEEANELASEVIDDYDGHFPSLGIENIVSYSMNDSSEEGNGEPVENDDVLDSSFSNNPSTETFVSIPEDTPSQRQSPMPVEETAYDPDAFFAKLTKARETAGIGKSLTNHDEQIRDETVEVAMDESDAFVANLTRTEESALPENSPSPSIDSPFQNDEAATNDPEPYLVDISEEDPIDDPELFYSNILDASERQESRISKGSLPGILEDEYQNDGLEDLGDSYERFLAGLSDEVVPSGDNNPEIEPDSSGIDQVDKRYLSSYSDEDMSILHREMKDIGLSPNIVVKNHDSMGTSVRSSLSARWSIGGDSYLDDLLAQRDELEDEHREEIMEEALAQYDDMDGPKYEDRFLEVLEKVTAQKKDEFEKKILAHDKLISQELEFRKHPSRRKLFSENEQKQNDDENYPEIGELSPMKGTWKPVRSKKKKSKPVKTARDSSRNTKPRKQKKEGRTKRKDDAKNSRRNKKDALPRAQKHRGKSIPKGPLPIEEKKRRSVEKRSSGKSNDRKKKTTLPMVEESPSMSSQPHSITGFDDEYYYDVERAMLDRKALRVSQQEAQLSRQEFKNTKRRLLASALMFCLAFGLILVFVLDPLQKRDA